MPTKLHGCVYFHLNEYDSHAQFTTVEEATEYYHKILFPFLVETWSDDYMLNVQLGITSDPEPTKEFISTLLLHIRKDFHCMLSQLFFTGVCSEEILKHAEVEKTCQRIVDHFHYQQAQMLMVDGYDELYN